MLNLDSELIKKYNRQGPRYTSYPTAVQFAPINHEQSTIFLAEELKSPKKLSIYVHLPFCKSMCWYCGCTTVISKNPDVSKTYIQTLIQEIKKTAESIHQETDVHQIHYGGGTPTFLREEELILLTESIKSNFNVVDSAEMSIEIDPRTVSKSQILALADVGFKRASLGVQDVTTEVQQAIHRVQSLDQNAHAMEWLREAHFNSINVDLIYGLPKQSPDLFKQTLDTVEFLDPERIALYSYAHIPWIKPAQKLIKEEDLPQPESKLIMFQMALKQFQEKGWEYIGMDHFAKKNDELANAKNNGSLHRNFQGYSTKAGLDMIAFGMSGIAQVGDAYLQKHRIIQQWSKGVQEYGSTYEKGYFLTEDDRIRKHVIMKIMCSQEINWCLISNQFGVDAKTYFGEEIKQIEDFENDKLIDFTSNGFRITDLGRVFLRNIAMVFDSYLNTQKAIPTFSKTI